MEGIFLNIVIGLGTGIIAGLYTGIAMTKYLAFCQARMSILDIVRRFGLMSRNNELESVSLDNYTNITYIISTLFYLKHRQAGEDAQKILSEITEMQTAKEAYFRFKALRQPIPHDNTANINVEMVAALMERWQ